jgi:hypothetical protein
VNDPFARPRNEDVGNAGRQLVHRSCGVITLFLSVSAIARPRSMRASAAVGLHYRLLTPIARPMQMPGSNAKPDADKGIRMARKP